MLKQTSYTRGMIQSALVLRLDGKTYRQIGTALGVSRQRIQQILMPRPAVWNAVKNRANGRCERCGLAGEFHPVHHCGAGKDQADTFNDLENLQYLCVFCHRRIHADATRKPPIPRKVRIFLPSRAECKEKGICAHCRKVPAKSERASCQDCLNKISACVKSLYIPRLRQKRPFCKAGHSTIPENRNAQGVCKLCKQIRNRTYYLRNAVAEKAKRNARRLRSKQKTTAPHFLVKRNDFSWLHHNRAVDY